MCSLVISHSEMTSWPGTSVFEPLFNATLTQQLGYNNQVAEVFFLFLLVNEMHSLNVKLTCWVPNESHLPSNPWSRCVAALLSTHYILKCVPCRRENKLCRQRAFQLMSLLWPIFCATFFNCILREFMYKYMTWLMIILNLKKKKKSCWAFRTSPYTEHIQIHKLSGRLGLSQADAWGRELYSFL